MKMKTCPNCGHAEHDNDRCAGRTDEGQGCVCSWPDPYNYPSARGYLEPAED